MQFSPTCKPSLVLVSEIYANHIIHNFYIIFVASIEAVDDMWLVGDSLLKETYGMLEAMRQSALKKNTNNSMPYIHAYFNMLERHTRSSSTGLVHFINPLIDLLNERPRLPKFIIVIPDKDLLAALKGMTMALVLGSSIHYIIKQMDLLIQR